MLALLTPCLPHRGGLHLLWNNEPRETLSPLSCFYSNIATRKKVIHLIRCNSREEGVIWLMACEDTVRYGKEGLAP